MEINPNILPRLACGAAVAQERVAALREYAQANPRSCNINTLLNTLPDHDDLPDAYPVTYNPECVEPARVLELAVSLLQAGWDGPPVVTIRGDTEWLTGTHRAAALQVIGWAHDDEVPTQDFEELLDEHADADEVLEVTGNLQSNLVPELIRLLPTDIQDQYGLDCE